MKRTSMLSAVVALSACGAAAVAQPDVIVGELNGISNYTASGGIHAYSVGTTSCNIGNQPLLWIAGNNQHPVIGQSMHRFRIVNGAGQFEQIGASHLKHGFTALQENACFSDCQAHPNGTRLGVRCSDPYGAGLNGIQSGLGPRDEVNAATGAYPYPFTSRSYSGSIARRLQVLAADLDPAQGNSNALYFVSGHYITPDDAAAGNGGNNASYRRAFRSSGTSNWTFSLNSSNPQYATRRQLSPIYAWQECEPGVTVREEAVPTEPGLRTVVQLGSKVTPIANNMYHYEYALHNLNSHDSVRGFVVNFPTTGNPGCIEVENVGFRDIFYHSGEPWQGTDWAALKTATGHQWTTDTFAANPNANALRWGTTYTFRFDSPRPPVAGTVTLQLYRSGGTMTIPVQVPSSCECPDPDFNGDGNVDQDDIACLEQVVGGNSACSSADADLNNDGNVDQDDIAYLAQLVAGSPC
ncbi:MAG: dockerin type I repeat-containing protein [Planctomycetota bacterium]|nr:dockerin type I repeat-containing protein [Planctomycetota bacterium]